MTDILTKINCDLKEIKGIINTRENPDLLKQYLEQYTVFIQYEATEDELSDYFQLGIEFSIFAQVVARKLFETDPMKYLCDEICFEYNTIFFLLQTNRLVEAYNMFQMMLKYAKKVADGNNIDDNNVLSIADFIYCTAVKYLNTEVDNYEIVLEAVNLAFQLIFSINESQRKIELTACLYTTLAYYYSEHQMDESVSYYYKAIELVKKMPKESPYFVSCLHIRIDSYCELANYYEQANICDKCYSSISEAINTIEELLQQEDCDLYFFFEKCTALYRVVLSRNLIDQLKNNSIDIKLYYMYKTVYHRLTDDEQTICLYEAVCTAKRIVKRIINIMNSSNEDYISDTMKWFDLLVKDYCMLEKEKEKEKRGEISLDSDTCPLSLYFYLGDYLYSMDKEKANTLYEEGKNFINTHIPPSYHYNGIRKTKPNRIVFQEVEGYHPINMELMSEDLFNQLPNHIKKISESWWLKPEQLDFTSKYVDNDGNIKKCSTFQKHGFRPILILGENIRNASLYEEVHLFQEDWLVISDNMLFSKNTLSDMDAHSSLHGVDFPQLNTFDTTAEWWYYMHFRVLESPVPIINGVLEIPEWVESIDSKIFRNNIDIKRIIIPESVQNLGVRTFSCCENLESVLFKHHGNRFGGGSGIFSICPKLKRVEFEDWETFWNISFDLGGPLENGSELFINGLKISTVVILNSVPYDYCLKNLTGISGMKSITFEDGIRAVCCEYNGNIFLTKETLLDEIIKLYPTFLNDIIIRDNSYTLDILRGEEFCGFYDTKKYCRLYTKEEEIINTFHLSNGK